MMFLTPNRNEANMIITFILALGLYQDQPDITPYPKQDAPACAPFCADNRGGK